MKQFAFAIFAASLLTSGCGATTESLPTAETQPSAAALPRNEADLRHLNSVQSDIVRRAERQCMAEGSARANDWQGHHPCLVAAVDSRIEDSNDSALQAFHAALPRSERYDHRRGANAWRSMVAEDGTDR